VASNSNSSVGHTHEDHTFSGSCFQKITEAAQIIKKIRNFQYYPILLRKHSLL
jgi:hypothetical protein